MFITLARESCRSLRCNAFSSRNHFLFTPGVWVTSELSQSNVVYQVGCKVRTYYSGRNVTSPWLDSNTYWAGIRVSLVAMETIFMQFIFTESNFSGLVLLYSVVVVASVCVIYISRWT